MGSNGAGIDVLPTLERFRAELEACTDPTRHGFLLSILERWQHDLQLTNESRRLAGELRRRFLTDS